MSKMEQVLSQASQIKGIGTKNGVPVVSYEDASVLSQKQMIQDTLGEVTDLGDADVNPDGTLGSTRATAYAMNEEKRLANRYRVMGKKGGGGKLLQVVTDERAVKEHDTGKVYMARIPAYEFERGEDGKLTMTRLVTVEASDFISKFDEELNKEAMYEVLSAISSNEDDASKSEMPI